MPVATAATVLLALFGCVADHGGAEVKLPSRAAAESMLRAVPSVADAAADYYRREIYPLVSESDFSACLREALDDLGGRCVRVPEADPPRELCLVSGSSSSVLGCPGGERACRDAGEGYAMECVCAE